MGTRQLQKLQGKELLPGQDEATSEESESGDEVGAAPAFNPFLLLGDEVLPSLAQLTLAWWIGCAKGTTASAE